MQVNLGKKKIKARNHGFNKFVYTLSIRDFMIWAGKPVVLQPEFLNPES